jgi:hypothetical protein
MKTSIFNFNRVGLLFQRYFAERFHTELIYWGIMIIVFMFIRNVTPIIFGLIFIAGAFYAARFFKEIHSRSNGIAYFMIPATQLEKLTVGIVITSFYYFAMMMIAYVIGNLLGTLFNNMLANMNFLVIFSHSPLQWKLFNLDPFWNNFGKIEHLMDFRIWLLVLLLYTQSLYLLGSIYFKSNQFLKTFLTTKLIGFLLFIFFIIEILLIFGHTQSFDEVNFPYWWDQFFIYALQAFVCLLIPFFWVVSYFRLTEKQV